MLVNEMYIGNLVQGKYGSVSYKTHKNKPKSKENWIRAEHTHEAIIDIELWNRVQKLIREKPILLIQVKLEFLPVKYIAGIVGMLCVQAKIMENIILDVPQR